MIYAFTGKKRCGKSTACAYLKDKLKATQINFKDALVSEMKQHFPDVLNELVKEMNTTQYDGWGWSVDRLFQEKPPIMRALMQNFGTNLRREENPNHWVKQWMHSVATIEGNVATDDVRFINEAHAVKAFDGVIIKIVREGQENTDTHISETEMDKIEPDHVISVADGDLESLYRKLDEIV